MEQHGIHVYVLERDIYARQAIISYLSWDRRTRVVGNGSRLADLQADLELEGQVRIDAILLDTGLASSPEELASLIKTANELASASSVLCLTHTVESSHIEAALRSGAGAYLSRESVGLGIANAVRFALAHPFCVTRDVLEVLDTGWQRWRIQVLPQRRRYPRLTERIEQALWLCVVEGLPAELAAEEMGVSTSTVRSYIKEGYRILEASDDTIYPIDMSPVERAFLRYTALDGPPDTPAPQLHAA